MTGTDDDRPRKPIRMACAYGHLTVAQRHWVDPGATEVEHAHCEAFGAAPPLRDFEVVDGCMTRPSLPRWLGGAEPMPAASAVQPTVVVRRRRLGRSTSC